MAWLCVADTNQQGGSVLTLIDKAGQRVDREWKFGATARFRLLLKDSLIEFYLDDLLMQCSSLPQMATGRIGLIQGGQGEAISNLKAWRCLEAEISAAVGGHTSPRPEGKAQLQIEYLAALKHFVSDVHRDVKLDTVYVGSIGNVPHTIGSAAISTRENIYHIRRALQDSWQDPLISPGPVVYDVPLASDPIHIHFNSPEEMIPLAKRWAAAIRARTYKTEVGRGPILQKAEPGRDDRTVSRSPSTILGA